MSLLSGKRKEKRVVGLKAGVLSGLIVLLLVVGIVGYGFMCDPVDDIKEWHVVDVVTSDMLITGENSIAAGASGWLSAFHLDYGEDPGTVLANNATDWSGAATADGYVDADDIDTDLASENGAYIVVRCRFNDSVKDGADFIGSRCRCTLTVSGDETISGVAQVGDDDGTDNNGGGTVSQNGTDYIYINFWWDDNSDGYRITDDGSLTWSIVIEAKY